MKMISKPIVSTAAGFAVVATAASITAALLRFQPTWFAWNAVGQLPENTVCTTIATDPDPPLNVRSSPVKAPDNIVGKVNNGTELSVIDENGGWLRVSQPIAGWVYKPLTVTSCVSEQAKSQAANSPQPNSELPSAQSVKTLTLATEQYQAGNLNAAIALAQTIPSSDPTHSLAQTTIAQWQQDWQRAEAEFYHAQSALSQGKSQEVLETVQNFPANRFWRQRLTPIVKKAIEQQRKK